MATVTGVNAARAQQIEDASIVSAEIDGNDLVLTTHGGLEINVGRIIPPLYEYYPVGSIYLSVSSANPSTYLGGGTWAAWGQGRVPVSVDEGQTEFNEVEKVGGSKTHELTIAQMPAHNHGGVTSEPSEGHTHSGTTQSAGAHTHTYQKPDEDMNFQSGGSSAYTDSVNATTSSAGAHTHTFTTGAQSDSHTHTLETDGEGEEHNILQPFITCFMWKRTA